MTKVIERRQPASIHPRPSHGDPARARLKGAERAKRSLTLVAAALVVLGAQSPAAFAEEAFTVAISPDMPPYVMNKATSGIEVDLFEQVAPDHELRFIQMPYAELQKAVTEKRADAAAGVQKVEGDGVFYSNPFVTFQNFAIVKKSAGLAIQSVADLAKHRVLAWQGADVELGPEFKALFAVGSPQRANYVEVADQREQVKQFWAAPADVIVIDEHVFRAISKELGHSASDVVMSDLFPPTTDVRVAFGNAETRDSFDQGLMALCLAGNYQTVLQRYDVKLKHDPCDR